MEYTDQHINSIRLFLVEGDPQLSQFRTLAQNTFVWGDIHVSFGILGESHFVKLYSKDATLTEICACTDGTFDDAESQLIYGEFFHKLEKLPITHTWQNVSYTFAYQHMDYTRGIELLADLRHVQQQGSTHFLQYTFPSSDSSVEKPVTEVFIKESNNSLYLRTIHTYPNDRKVAVTQSKFSTG